MNIRIHELIYQMPVQLQHRKKHYNTVGKDKEKLIHERRATEERYKRAFDHVKDYKQVSANVEHWHKDFKVKLIIEELCNESALININGFHKVVYTSG